MIDVVVTTCTAVAEGVRGLTLEAADGRQLPSFEPGAHVDLHLHDGLSRPYSLCGSPLQPGPYQLAVKLEPRSRGGSLAVHRDIEVGSRLRVSLPRNQFALHPAARYSLLMAGGIGITPLLSMAHWLSAQRSPFELHVFARSMSHLAFAPLLDSDVFSAHVHRHLGLDAVETAAAAQAALRLRPAGAHAYLCGPAPFMAVVQERAAACGWPADTVHTEYFNAPASTATSTGQGFDVLLARSGRRVAVPPELTIVEALRQAGIAIDTSCEQGVCGTCVRHVLGGTPAHRDLFLTETERASGQLIAPCVSRAHGPELVLDL